MSQAWAYGENSAMTMYQVYNFNFLYKTNEKVTGSQKKYQQIKIIFDMILLSTLGIQIYAYYSVVVSA